MCKNLRRSQESYFVLVTIVAERNRLQEWIAQIWDCQSRPADMSIFSWCACHGITKANYYYRLRHEGINWKGQFQERLLR